MDCPFLRPVMADHMWMYPTGAYCRLPSGRVRVPSRDTFARLCTSGCFYECPRYRVPASKGEASSNMIE